MQEPQDNPMKSVILEQFPRSAKYDTMWMLENQMGPNALWLTEALCQVMDLKPGMRILDMGCGRAISSIFLAKEFGVQVWATDLWITATDNWKRIRSAGLDAQIFPINAEARALPFADEFFDAAVSIDAYHYFGTDDLYLGNYFNRLIKHKGIIGIVVPGLANEFDSVPDPLKPYWSWDWCSFHSPNWWKNHFEKTGKVKVLHSDLIPDGWKHWLLWQEVRRNKQFPYDENEMALLRIDSGKNLGFTRLIAQKVDGA